MGQRFSKQEHREKTKPCYTSSRKEVVEIVYDDTDQTEILEDVSGDKLLMFLNEAEISAWQSPMKHSNYVPPTVPTQDTGSMAKQKVTGTTLLHDTRCRCTYSTSAQSSETDWKASEYNFKGNSQKDSIHISHQSSDNQESSENLNASENTCALSPNIEQFSCELSNPTKLMINEQCEMVESIHSSTSSIFQLGCENQPTEKTQQPADIGLCSSVAKPTKFEQDMSGTNSGSRDKRRRLSYNTMNNPKAVTSPLCVSVDTTLPDSTSIQGQIEDIPSAHNLPISVTQPHGGAEKYSDSGKHRLVIKEDCNAIRGPEAFSSNEKDFVSHAATDTRSGSLPTITQSLQPDLGNNFSSICRPCTLSGDEQQGTHSTANPTDLCAYKPYRNWHNDPRFADSFEYELASTLSGPTTTMTVTAFSPEKCKKRFKALTLITVKPEEKLGSTTPISFESTIKSVGDIRESGITLDSSIYPDSDELKLVPECIELMKHSCLAKSKRRFGLQVGDTNFIGGNRTRRKVTRLKRSLSKRSTPAPPSRIGHQSSRPASSIRTPIPSQPIHIYTYRFWVSCEPWIEKLFRNPSDRRIESIGRISDCHIRLTRRRRRNTQGFRQQMVSIVAPNAEALEKCCKLFDDKFPCFYATAGLILSHDQLKRLSRSPIRTDGRRSKRDRCASVSSVPMKTKNVAQHITSQMTTNMNEYSKLATYSHTRPYVFDDRLSIFD